MSTNDQEKQMTMGTQGVRRLTRRTQNKMVAGVAAGLGDYFNVDPIWFRLGFVFSTFLGGFGILAYLVLLVVMPTDAEAARSPAENWLERAAGGLRSTPAWIGAALVILGAILVLTQAFDWRPGVVWGVALIVMGVLFFTERGERSEPGRATGSAAPATDTALLEPPAGPPAGPPSEPPTGVPAGAVPPPPPRVRERSTLGVMTLGAMLVAIGVVTLLDIQDVIELTAVQYPAIALGVIGLGLVVGTFIGRARWLIVPGVFLIPFVLAASMIHVPFEGGFGQRDYRPTGVAPLNSEYHIIAGEMTIDLTQLTVPGSFKVEATAVAGRIVVIVPEGMALDVTAKVGGGEILLFGQRYDGVKVNVHRTFNSSTATAATLDLDIEAAFGRLEVQS